MATPFIDASANSLSRIPPRPFSPGRRVRNDLQASIELPAPRQVDRKKRPFASISCDRAVDRDSVDAIEAYFPLLLYCDSFGNKQQARLVPELDLHNLVASQYQLRRQLKAKDALIKNLFSNLQNADDEHHELELTQNPPRLTYQRFDAAYEPIDMYMQSLNELVYIHRASSKNNLAAATSQAVSIPAASQQHTASTTATPSIASQSHETNKPDDADPNNMLAGSTSLLYDPGPEDEAAEHPTAATEVPTVSDRASNPRQLSSRAPQMPAPATQVLLSGNGSPESPQQPSPLQALLPPPTTRKPSPDDATAAVSHQTSPQPPQTAPADSPSTTLLGSAPQSSNPPVQPVTVSKPDYSNANLVGMALHQLPGQSATVAEIRDWLKANFVYFGGGHAATYWVNVMRGQLTKTPHRGPHLFQRVNQPASARTREFHYRIVPGQEHRFAALVTQWTATKAQPAVQPSITVNSPAAATDIASLSATQPVPTVAGVASASSEGDIDVSLPVGTAYNLQVRAFDLKSSKNTEGNDIFPCCYNRDLQVRFGDKPVID